MLVSSDFISSLEDEPQTLQCCHCHLWAQACYLVYGKDENAHYWFTKFWSTYTGQARLCLMFFISSHGIPEAVLPCSPASNACRKLQALLKAVSRAHPCSPLPGQAGQLKFPGTTKQGLFGHCQAASGLLPLGCQGSCTERKWTDLGGGQEWEWGSQTGAQSKLVIMLTIQAATQNGFFLSTFEREYKT